MASWPTDRLLAEVQRLGRRGLPRDEYHRELGARLRRTIPFEAACWHGLDPETLLLTTANPEELLEHGLISAETEPLAGRAVVASEYVRPDYNTSAALARRREPAAVLSETTRGRPQRSARYADFLQPHGTPHERAAFVTRKRAWAAWCCTAPRDRVTSRAPTHG